MDKRTRVKSAMDCLPVDHTPVGFWVHFFDKGIFGDACVKAHLDYYSALDLDFVKVMSDGYFGFPNGLKVESVDDLYRMKPIEADHPWITDQVERAAAIVDKLGGERMVFFNVFNPFSSLKYGFTDDLIKCDEIMMKFVREDKNAVKRALDIVVAGSALLCELLVKKAGCDGIYYCVQNAETDRFAKTEYEEMVGHAELNLLEHINRHSEYNIMHCCGFMGKRNRVDLWYDYPVKCVNWATAVEDLPLWEGRHLFGNKAILGGFDTHWGMESADEQRGILYHGTESELRAYTRDLVVNTGKRGMMIGGDCTMDFRIDYDRVRWIIEAAREI